MANNFFGDSGMNGLSNMYGNLSGSWSDFSMINSGSYKKLLKSYYSTVNDIDSDSSSSSSKTERTQKSHYTVKSATELDAEKSGKTYRQTVDTTEFAAIQSSSKSLSNAVNALASEKLYQEPEEDETETAGTTTKKKDVTSSVKSALKDYVSAYNSYMNTARSSNSNSIQAKNLKMFQANADNAKALKELGITTDKNGKLVFDESKFDSSKVDDVKELFSEKGSYGDEMKKVADETYRIANNTISSYSTSGAYSVLGTTNSALDQYL